MATVVPPTKTESIPTFVSSSSPSYLSAFSAFTSPITNALSRFSSWKSEKGLPYPGSIENLQNEVRQTHLTSYMFDGFRADLAKGFSMNPTFQISHNFQLGSREAPSSYSMMAVFANPTLTMQGNVSDEGNVSGRFYYNWSESQISRIQAQLAGPQSVGVLEHEVVGRDYSLAVRGINVSPADLTGVYSGSYLQSITKNFAVGIDAIYQRPTPAISEIGASYVCKYTGDNKDWIATAMLQPAGILQATYWHKLSEKVEVAAELQLMNGPQRREAITTVGAKYEMRMANFRAQIDSTGKVSSLLEQKVAPAMSLLLSGEIDHWKNSAKFGVGVQIESSNLTPEQLGLVPPQPGPYQPN